MLFAVSVPTLTSHCQNNCHLHRTLQAWLSLTKFSIPLSHLVVPAESADTHAVELSNIIAWAATNNLKLNKVKTKEVVFYDSRRRRELPPPPLLPGVDLDTTLKVLGVTMSSNRSASDHIRHVVSDSAQTLYALRVFRHHSMNDAGLQTVFRAVVVSRLTYASPAWRGFITGADLQRVDAFLRRCKRSHYCPSDMPDIVELMEEADERLFRSIPWITLTTLCTRCSHRNQQRRRTISSGSAFMIDNSLYIWDTWSIKTL